MPRQTVNPIQPISVYSTGNGVYQFTPLTRPRCNPVLNNQNSNYTQSVPLFNVHPPQVAPTLDKRHTMSPCARPEEFAHLNTALINVKTLGRLTGSCNPVNIPGSRSTVN